MKTSRNFPRPVRTALGLAVGSAAINVIGSFLFSPSAWPDLGSTLVFLAVGALPLSSAFLVACLSTVLELAIVPERLDIVRIVFLAAGAGLLLRVFPRLPLFAAVGLLWLSAILPSILNPISLRGDLVWSNESLMLMGMWDVLLAIGAGLLLLNPAIWSLVNGKARHVSLQQVLNHGIAGAALFPVIGAVLLFGLDGWMRRPETAGNVVVLLGFSLLLAVWLAERIALLFAANASPLLQSANAPGRRFRSFSQLATEVWREPRALWGKGAQRSVTERELARSRGVLASSQGRDLGICALSRNGTIAFMNERFRELAEVTSSETLGRLFGKLGMNQRVKDAVQQLAEESFAKGCNQTAEVRLNQFPAPLAFLKINTELPHQRTTSDAQSIIVTLTDISARRTVGYDVIAAQRKDSLQNLVAGMSHALNNSLTAIGGHASTARRCEDPFALDQSLDAVVEATREAGVLVKQLLDFSNGRSYAPKREELDKLLQSHRGILRGIAGESHSLECSIPNKTISVECDAGLMLLAVTNLVLSARESYQEGAGPIFISLDEETLSEDAPQILPGSHAGTFARIQVRDNGHGMGPEALRKLLNPEHHQDASSSRVGLTLATAYAIVRAHDGFLTAESHPDRGTTVALYLPLLASDAPVTSTGCADTIDQQREAASACTNILVVEDDDNIREVVRSMLSTLGYNVATCSNGVEAIARCDERAFDLVLVDLVMPKMYGLEVIEHLKHRHPQLQTLLMTGSGHLMGAGGAAVRMLPKPFDIETLSQAIRESLKSSPTAPVSRPGEAPGGYVH